MEHETRTYICAKCGAAGNKRCFEDLTTEQMEELKARGCPWEDWPGGNCKTCKMPVWDKATGPWKPTPVTGENILSAQAFLEQIKQSVDGLRQNVARLTEGLKDIEDYATGALADLVVVDKSQSEWPRPGAPPRPMPPPPLRPVTTPVRPPVTKTNVRGLQICVLALMQPGLPATATTLIPRILEEFGRRARYKSAATSAQAANTLRLMCAPSRDFLSVTRDGSYLLTVTGENGHREASARPTALKFSKRIVKSWKLPSPKADADGSEATVS